MICQVGISSLITFGHVLPVFSHLNIFLLTRLIPFFIIDTVEAVVMTPSVL